MKIRNCFILLILFSFLGACKKDVSKSVKIEGYAQGTTFRITYLDLKRRSFDKEIDSIFKRINNSLSIYDSNSIISKINSNKFLGTPDDYFISVFKKSKEISDKTGGAFDITVGPLVNKWGFGNKKGFKNHFHPDSLLKLVNYNQVSLNEDGRLEKRFPAIELDVNGIAQGYTVDLLALLLEKKGIKDYMVEVGGEVRTSGKNQEGKYWRIGVDKPLENNGKTRVLQAVAEMKNFRSMATSGNYRKFYIKDGKKYSHTISPFTGRPVDHNLLSVSVFTDDCISADAYATAFMVLGYEKSLELLKNEPRMAAFFIVSENGELKTIATSGLNIQEIGDNK